MKTLLVTALFLPALTLAAELSSIAFSPQSIETPPLSLLEQAGKKRQEVRSTLVTNRRLCGCGRSCRPAVSRMPIITPRTDVAFSTPIIPPDESVDYKMLIKPAEDDTVE